MWVEAFLFRQRDNVPPPVCVRDMAVLRLKASNRVRKACCGKLYWKNKETALYNFFPCSTASFK